MALRGLTVARPSSPSRWNLPPPPPPPAETLPAPAPPAPGTTVLSPSVNVATLSDSTQYRPFRDWLLPPQGPRGSSTSAPGWERPNLSSWTMPQRADVPCAARPFACPWTPACTSHAAAAANHAPGDPGAQAPLQVPAFSFWGLPTQTWDCRTTWQICV